MFILGDLLSLSLTDQRLPLPWWHRAPLALESGTHVYVALTEPKEDRPGDILVSVLDPTHWDKIFRIRCYYEERPGVVAKVFGVVASHKWNIALAETVTVDGGRSHAVDLFCEPSGWPTIDPDISPLVEELRQSGFQVERQALLGPARPQILWTRVGEVRSGWVVNKEGQGLPWRVEVEHQIAGLKRTDQFDLSKLVVSADTEKRFLRCVVPRVGVRNVIIEHADEPGALSELTTALQRAGLNVLSSLLKRGGAQARNAVLVAVCEPSVLPSTNGVTQVQQLDADITEQVKNIPCVYRADIAITSGKQPRTVIYSRRRDDVVITVPRHLKPRVLDRRASLDRKKVSIFLSQRFIGGRPESYADEVRKVLKENGCNVVQASIRNGGIQTSFDEVSAAMWASNAGIVLVACPDDHKDAAFSLNLAHEFGFFQGQGKPLLVLVENDTKVIADLDQLTNVKGVTAPRFSRDQAFHASNPQSIASKIAEWLKEVRAGDD
jgi:hypothetical protein